jgi:hypothetical protein
LKEVRKFPFEAFVVLDKEEKEVRLFSLGGELLDPVPR